MPESQSRPTSTGKQTARKRTSRAKEQPIDWAALQREARQRFGIRALRPGQRAVIEQALRGRHVLGLMPTGSGKSLCFQLPSLFLPKTTVVVAPLIALMKDQKEKVDDAGIEAAQLNSAISAAEQRDSVESLHAGELNLVYVTPERLEKPEFLDSLKQAGVSLLVVDEAHCISQWGHDFRPAYLALRDAARKLGGVPIMALSATATPEVVEDVVAQLGMQGAEVVNTGIERDNLLFEVFRTVSDGAKQERIRAILEEEKGQGIIYTATVRHANELCTWLEQNGVHVGHYHGKLPARKRTEVQEQFMGGELRVLVATKAFGLGINKPDVRFVVHYSFPDSLESYYQEAGRAGRDGKPSRCVLLYRLEDRRVQAFFLGGKYPSREESQRVYEVFTAGERQEKKLREVAEATGLPERRVKVIAAQLERAEVLARGRHALKAKRTFDSAEELDAFLSEYEQRYQSDRDRLDEMMRYAQSTRCRMQIFREYFGEEPGEACNHCDNCNSGATTAVEVAPANESPVEDRPELAAAMASHNTQMEGEAATEWLANVSEEHAFAPGERVRHRRFGPGEVVGLDPDVVEVRFEREGLKKVKPTYLKKAA